jgi:hypothetical protein
MVYAGKEWMRGSAALERFLDALEPANDDSAVPLL